MPDFRVGGIKPSKIMVAGAAAKKVMIGTGSAAVEAWTNVPALLPSGMTKNGVQALGNTNRQRITGWAVRSGYPATVINFDRIQIVGSGQVNVFAQVNFSGTATPVTHSRWIVHNGIDVAFHSASNQAEASLTTPSPIPVADGDFIWVDAQTNNVVGSYDDIATSTYITVTPVQ